MIKKIFLSLFIVTFGVSIASAQNVLVDSGQNALGLNGSTSFGNNPTGGLNVAYTIDGRFDIGTSFNWSEFQKIGSDVLYSVSPFISYLISKKESGFSASLDVAYLGFLQGFDELNSFSFGLSFYKEFGKEQGMSYLPFAGTAINTENSDPVFSIGVRMLPKSKNRDQFNFGPSLIISKDNTVFTLGLGYTFNSRKE